MCCANLSPSGSISWSGFLIDGCFSAWSAFDPLSSAGASAGEPDVFFSCAQSKLGRVQFTGSRYWCFLRCARFPEERGPNALTHCEKDPHCILVSCHQRNYATVPPSFHSDHPNLIKAILKCPQLYFMESKLLKTTTCVWKKVKMSKRTTSRLWVQLKKLISLPLNTGANQIRDIFTMNRCLKPLSHPLE